MIGHEHHGEHPLHTKIELLERQVAQQKAVIEWLQQQNLELLKRINGNMKEKN